MRSASLASWGAAALLLGAPAGPSRAADGDRIETLERKVRELEAREAERAAAAPEPASPEPGSVPATKLGDLWSQANRHVRLSGSASTGYFDGRGRSVLDPASFEVWDARFFLDAELGEAARLGDTTLVRNLGLSFEWNLVRLGTIRDDADDMVGDLYAELQGLGGSSWANARVGRFQIPVGENYLRFGRGYRDNPFITNTVGGPWWWDEGVRLDGSDAGGRFGYVASVTSGETPFGGEKNSDVMGSLKLWWKPTPWLQLSASGLASGAIGSDTSSANGALWLGETWATAFGSIGVVPNFVNGVAVPDGPSRLDDTWLVGGDAILHWRGARLWLAYGRYAIDSDGPGSLYDRDLHYWIAELVLRGDLAHPALSPFWLGLRANGLGSYDGDEGYLLDVRYAGSLGYNMESLEAYEVVLGWRLTRFAALRAQYAFVDVDLVNGVTPGIQRSARRQDKFAVDVSIWF